MNRIIVAIIALLMSVGFAQAKTLEFRANKTNQFHFVYQTTKQSCSHGPKIKSKVVKQPKHGTLKFVWARQKAWSKAKSVKKCFGKMVWGLAIYYTPKRGYRGKDSFTYSLGMANNALRTTMRWKRTSLNVNVK